jgi:general secretion pathway protein A
VLVGQPQLASLLLEPSLAQLNQRITLRWHLGPLTYAETVGYVRHRLGVASGGREKHLFTTPALVLLHRFSKGVPRLVNMIAHRALLVAYVGRRRRVSARAVLRAYGEIRAVPLRSAGRTRWAGWAVTAALALAIVTVGIPRLGIRFEMPVHETASARPTAPVVAPPPPPAAEVAPPTRNDAVERRLASLDPERSARTAIDTVLGAWRVAPLRPDEKPAPDALERMANERGLEDLRLNGNLSMLRLLDLPALLELRLPGTSGSRYVALSRMTDDRVFLSVGGETVPIDAALLDRLWFGEAHVLWRDFEALGRTFGTEARGEPVARLQRLLARAGVYTGSASGVFDPSTEAAVVAFQRSRLLVPDCRVGRLTRIVLYAAVDGYERPMLGGKRS